MHIQKYNGYVNALSVYNICKSLYTFSDLFLSENLIDFETFKGWIIQDDTEILGFLLYSKVSPRCYYLDHIGVVKQRCGLGQVLMTIFLDFLNKKNASSLLHIDKKNPQLSFLLKWYSKNGYEQIENSPKNAGTLDLILLPFVLTMGRPSGLHCFG